MIQQSMPYGFSYTRGLYTAGGAWRSTRFERDAHSIEAAQRADEFEAQRINE